MKRGKATGLSGIGVEMLQAAGDNGILWLQDLCCEERMYIS